jgi:phosphoribosyl 1,2-cyclic phosphodiesterase
MYKNAPVRLSLLGSGSSGNVALVEGGPAGARTRVLVDAGLPRAEIERRLASIPDGDAPHRPLALERIDAVLVTHDHRDHAGCAGALGRPVYATAATRRACQLDGATRVLAGEPFRVGALEVRPVGLPHDGEETVGYVLSDGHARVGILTDCGWEDPEVAAGYAGCDVLALETNHDATLLRYGPYPPSLKRRVGGRRGHLSNDQAAALLRAMCALAPAPRLVIASHISQANNRPQLAKSALDRVLGALPREGATRASTRVLVAAQTRPTPVIVIEGENGRVRIEPMRNEQLAFDFAPPPRPMAAP